MFPVDVKKLKDNTLSIVWDDGHQSEYSMDSLRRSCPCATCRTARASKKRNSSPLTVLSPDEVLPDQIEVREAEVVGRYALQFLWSDGHHEGIYSFDYLRQLCQCEQCRNNA